jgi:hypothetical protein
VFDSADNVPFHLQMDWCWLETACCCLSGCQCVSMYDASGGNDDKFVVSTCGFLNTTAGN